MRILFSSRTTLFSDPGGDTTVLVKTAEALRARGCEVEITVDPEPSLEGFDLLHLFNLTRPQEIYLQALQARERHIPIVLTPIYVDYRESDKMARRGWQQMVFSRVSGATAEYLKMVARCVTNREFNRGTLAVLKKGFRGAQRAVLEMVDFHIPHSESEMKRIQRDFPETRGCSYEVAYNAIDQELFQPGSAEPIPEFEGCVLSVGRFEPRKCQLELVRAVKGTDMQLVFIGKAGPNQAGYLQQIKAEMGSNVRILGHVRHEDLPRYYASCKVHALVSWMETAGLSSLESGAMGANVVITAKGDTRDYFADLAWYCEPDSIDSIRKALLDAHAADRGTALQERILERYTWERSADAMLKVYRKLLGQTS